MAAQALMSLFMSKCHIVVNHVTAKILIMHAIIEKSLKATLKNKFVLMTAKTAYA